MELVATQGDGRIAEVRSSGAAIESVRDGVDLVGNASFLGFELVVLRADQLPGEFFDLASGFAGEVLQKFSTYRVRLAIVGDFENVTSESLRAFIRESNRGKHVAFVPDMSTALGLLEEE